MEFYLFIVIILLLFAVIDLTVGVANDAVNFLNSAIGSKAASFKVVLLFASLGVLIGVLFSGGMMEVARSGIFNPQYFFLPELMMIFLAVMIQDILLLDVFNTLGLPTSTTVSIVFGLFGGALAFALLKIFNNSESFEMVFTYINTPGLFKIILAIVLSIVLAFVFGALIQFLTRLLFTFNYKKRLSRYGALWGGFALTCLTFFILLKGTKGAPFMTEEFKLFIHEQPGILFIYSFAIWAVILQVLMWLFKINVLKMIVLIGTFSLAMAFAANDLVNFIGAPLAALNTYQLGLELGDAAFTTPMAALKGNIQANTWILLFSGLIMVLALLFSKKARSVTRTTIRLSRQEYGYERFESNLIARAIVRFFINITNSILRIMPGSLKRGISNRFDESKYQPETGIDGELPAFDLIRAAVILMVASMLISLATYFKLPLSTTYVTFIVAMGCALPDKAWGRDSAVFRVSGVITVIGGWFFTAFLATLVAFTIAMILNYGQIYAVIGFLILVVFALIRTQFIHKKQEKEISEAENTISSIGDESEKHIRFNLRTADFVTLVNQTVSLSISSLLNYDLKGLKEAKKHSKIVEQELDKMIQRVIQLARKDDKESEDRSQTISRIISFLYNANDKIRNITQTSYKYVDNNHHDLTELQVEELKEINKEFDSIASTLADCFKSETFELCDIIKIRGNALNQKIRKFNKAQLKRIKITETKTRLSVFYLGLLSEIEELNDSFIKLSNYIANIMYISPKEVIDKIEKPTTIPEKREPKQEGTS